MQRSWNVFIISLVVLLLVQLGTMAANLGIIEVTLFGDAIIFLRVVFPALFIYALWSEYRMFSQIRDHKVAETRRHR